VNPKKLALEALRCPVRHAVGQAWDKSRTHAWRQGGNTVLFIPDEAVDQMKINLAQLTRLGVIEWWEMEVFEGWLRTDWQLQVKYTFRVNNVRQFGSERFHVW
jgi:hypothetical protein